MKTTVKTKWGNGFVSVGSPFVYEALAKKEDLVISYKDEEMTVPYEELLKKKPRSETFKDKKTNKEYQLFDFWWEIK